MSTESTTDATAGSAESTPNAQPPVLSNGDAKATQSADAAPSVDDTAESQKQNAPGKPRRFVKKLPPRADGEPVLKAPPKTWNPPKPSNMSTRKVWHIFVIAMLAVLLLFTILTRVITPTSNGNRVALDKPWTNKKDHYTIRAPIYWGIRDRFPSDEYVGISCAMAPKRDKAEPHTFGPLITVVVESAPGNLKSYVDLNKKNMEAEEKTVKWLSEDEDWINGCHATRLECEMDVENDENSTVHVREMLYVLDDSYNGLGKYFKIRCVVTASEYQNYLPIFEAVARSFERAPLAPPPDSPKK